MIQSEQQVKNNMKHQPIRKKTNSMRISCPPYNCVTYTKSFMYARALGKHMETCDKSKFKQFNPNNTLLPGKVIQGMGFQPQKLKKIGSLKNGKSFQIDIKKHKSIETASNKTQICSCTFCGMKFASFGNWKVH